MKKKIFFLFLLGGIYFFVAFQINFRCYASDENDLVISEVLPNPSGSEKENEFVELHNSTDKDISLDNWQLSIETIDLKSSDFFILSGNIKSGEYKSFYNTVTLYNKKSKLSLFSPESKLISEIIYTTPDNENFSYSLICNLWGWVYPATPNNKNPSCEKENEEIPEENIKNYSDKIFISEFLPAPSDESGNEEFIELYNPSDKNEDLTDWILRDGSKTGKYIFPKNTLLKSTAFLIIYKKDFKFALNNSGSEKVLLFNPNKKEVFRVEYSSSKTDRSYAFDGEKWRWTSLLTPGAENSFDKILSGKITLNKKIYKNTYAYFYVAVGKDTKKFVWDFGDGHKSYLKKTKHKYKKDGKYSASLKITGDGEDKTYDFIVKVEKYKAPKIRIVSFSPNPKGSDTKNEWIEIKNESQKKINLKNWSIATGWEKMINHPIREKFEIKAGKTKKLLRNICAFTLVNTKNKIELRDPSGKIVQKIKYNHGEESVSEDEIYSKIDKDWEWVETQNDTKNEIEHPLPSLKETNQKTNKENATITEEFILNIPDSEIQTSIGKYTLSPSWQKKKDTQQKLVLLNSKLQKPQTILANQPKVLGTQKISLVENYYFFINSSKQKHWAIELLENSWNKINFSLNYFRLKIAI